MWHTTKRAMLGMAVGALALAGAGCTTTGKENSIAYAQPDTKGIGPQAPRANTVYGMARLMRSQGKHEQAELALIGLTREYPNYSPAYNDLAEIRIEQGRLEEAVAYVDKGLEISPNDAVLLNNAGVCSLMKHDYEKALEYFKRASIIAPVESRYRANVALALGLTGDIEGARALYYQVVSAKEAEHNMEVIRQMVAPQEIITPTD